MLRPITCGKQRPGKPPCTNCLGWFDAATGCLRNSEIPAGVRVFGAFLHCSDCHADYKFDGLTLKKKEYRRASQNSPQPPQPVKANIEISFAMLLTQ
jgi:hypothetical protein